MNEALKTVDADTLLSTSLQKTFFVVDELIPQGVTMLCGDSKIGKSWMMLWLGLQVSQGFPYGICRRHNATCCISVWRIPFDRYRTGCIS